MALSSKSLSKGIVALTFQTLAIVSLMSFPPLVLTKLPLLKLSRDLLPSVGTLLTKSPPASYRLNQGLSGAQLIRLKKVLFS